MALLYKYRGLENFKFFVDIVLKQRLFAAPYSELNDPMEGMYFYNGQGNLNSQIKERIKGEKETLRICSLSRDPLNTLMWSHYSEGHKGVAIGIRTKKHASRRINYDGPLRFTDMSDANAIDVFTRKHSVWEYEQEERIFISGSNFVPVEVHEVICGQKMSNMNFGLIRELCDKINSTIKIDRLTIDDNGLFKRK